MEHPTHYDFHVRIPRFQLKLERWRGWLPAKGNVVFTLAIVALLLMAGRAGALPLGAPAAPSTTTIPYQGRLANADGTPFNGPQVMAFRLYDVPTGGTVLWEEGWSGGNSVQVSDGLFSVLLGSLNNTLAGVVQSRPQLWLGIEVGTDAEMTPRVQLGSAAYAMQALTVPDGSITTAKIADGAVTKTELADGSVTNAKLSGGSVTASKVATASLGVPTLSLDAWGPVARAQGLIVMPEGRITDDGNGNISFDSLVIMNPLAGTFIRVQSGSFHLPTWGYLYVEIPPTAVKYSAVVARVGEWQHSERSFEGQDYFLLAQRMSSGPVFFKWMGWSTR